MSKGYNFIVAKKLANKVLGDDYEVVETYLGKDLEYREYEQFLPILKVNKKAFYITCADYVTMEDGTGIVHIAPAFGQDDYEVGIKYDLPMLNPVDEQGCYKEGPWKGRLVVEKEVKTNYLKNKKWNITIHIVGDVIRHLFTIQNQVYILRLLHIKIRLLLLIKQLTGIHLMLEKKDLETG